MAYNASIPQPSDRLKDSQPELLANFQEISTFVNVNHAPFGDPNEGKHIYVEMVPQTGSPPIVFPAGENALYSFLNPTTSQNEIYVNKTQQAAVVQIPLTASILSVTNFPGNQTDGWSYLPSGLIIKWGTGQGTGDASWSFPVGATIPVFTQLMNVVLCTSGGVAGDQDTFVRLKGMSATAVTFWAGKRTVLSSPTLCFFSYVAIGR